MNHDESSKFNITKHLITLISWVPCVTEYRMCGLWRYKTESPFLQGTSSSALDMFQ